MLHTCLLKNGADASMRRGPLALGPSHDPASQPPHLAQIAISAAAAVQKGFALFGVKRINAP